jgi:hypothetical protein
MLIAANINSTKERRTFNFEASSPPSRTHVLYCDRDQSTTDSAASNVLLPMATPDRSDTIEIQRSTTVFVVFGSLVEDELEDNFTRHCRLVLGQHVQASLGVDSSKSPPNDASNETLVEVDC